MNKQDKAVLLAWGYYSAAIRGEIPRLVSNRRVREWLAGTKMCQRIPAQHHEQWVGQVATHVMRVLIDEWGVVRGARNAERP